jgi:hypothetical protein
MEFFDKKQDVLDLKLTSYGKQLLSRGLFKPVYYSFSDDGVMYDPRWMSGSLLEEHQSEAEPRIQERTPKLKTQYRKVGVERGVYNTLGGLLTPGYSQTIQELVEMEFSSIEELNQYLTKLNLNVGFAESEKLLENTLGIKSYFNSYNPAWNVLFYNGTISGSTGYYKKNNITTLTPQLNCVLKDKVYKIPYDTDIDNIPQVSEILLKLDKAFSKPQFSTDEEETTFYDLEDIGGRPSDISLGETPNINYFQEFTLAEDEGSLLLIKDFLFLSVEEANVEYTKDNFTIEIYEVTTTENTLDEEEELQQMYFDGVGPAYLKINNVFDIQLDDEIDSQLACALITGNKAIKDKNIYNTDVFDCVASPQKEGVSVNPYDNLPDVDVGDVC